MAKDACFVICTERGFLEGASILLCESIRKFAGRCSGLPIYSFAPRSGRDISKSTAKAFFRLGVNHEHRILNKSYSDYALANKPFVASYAESHLHHSQIVFLDSDTIVMNDLSGLLLKTNHDVALAPDHTKNIGSAGQRDPNDAYWQKLYSLCKSTRKIWTTTTVDRSKVRGYWNSGVVVARQNCGVFSAWLTNFRRAMKKNLKPSCGQQYFVEQSVLSATVLGLDCRIRTLPSTYNYPMNHQLDLMDQRRERTFDQVSVVHYSRLFQRYLPAFRWLFDHHDCEKKRWLVTHLGLLGICVKGQK